jgi:hypothetical protein
MPIDRINYLANRFVASICIKGAIPHNGIYDRKEELKIDFIFAYN